MEQRIRFRKHTEEIIDSIGRDYFAYDESEFWMIQPAYEYIEHYALDNRLRNTAIALPLARGIHNGGHRKSSVTRNGISYRLPYVIHCLMVCRMLIDLDLPLPKDEKDVVLAAALCHDMIEDIPFPDHGKEIYTKFHLDPRVYETVKLVSKRKDFTEEEEKAHFNGIESNPMALLVKLSDRGHNVEDLYNMKVWKVHEYVGETEKFFLPMCSYGLEHYPHLRQVIEILQDKIVSLTQASVILVDRLEAREKELLEELEMLKAKNAILRKQYSDLWEG